METKANNLIVGIFVLATCVVGVLFAVWLSRTGNSGPKKEFFVIFNGSVQGLAQGSFVLFSGLRVGEVVELGINPGKTSEIRARVKIDELTPVKRDSITRLTYAGLTGVAAIEVTGGNSLSEDLIPGEDGMPPALYSERSFVQNILESGSDTLNRINSVVGKLDTLIDENDDIIAQAIKDMAQAATNIEHISRSAEDVKLVDDLSATAKSVRRLSETLDQRVTVISSDISRFTDKGLKEFQGLISDGRRTLNSLDGTVRDLGRNPQQVIFGRPSVPTYKGQ